MKNEVIVLYRPGKDITCKATAALTGKHLCAITGNRSGGPLAAGNTDLQSLYQIGAPAAGGRVFGVVGYDVALGDAVPVKRSGIMPVVAGAALAAEQEVMVQADGTIIPVTAGNYAVGVVHTACANGADAEFEMYASPSKR